MNLQVTKIELIEMLISTKKTSILKKIKAILEEEQDFLNEQDYKIINTRRENHLNGESKSYSWQEAKEKFNILKQS